MKVAQRIHFSRPRLLMIFTMMLVMLISGVLLVQPAFAATNTFSNTGSITIPNSGAASPSPSTITVSGITDTVIDVDVTLNGLTHTFPDDIDILLVGPGGQSVILMSDAGGSFDVNNLTITFDQSALLAASNNFLLCLASPCTRQPTNYGSGDTFAAPAPAGPYGNSLNDFNGVSPNGTWSLYVVDDLTGDSGSISGGWSLTITTGVAPTITSADHVVVPPGSSGAFHTLTATGDPSTFLWLCTPPSITYWYIGCFPSLGGSNILGSLPSQGGLSEGIYNIGVQARNGVQPHATQSFTLYVGDVPVITSANNTAFTEGMAGTFNVTSTGSPTITYSLSGAPAWVSIDANTGVLSGTPDPGTAVTGSFTFDIIADNFLPGNATQSFTLYVIGDAPVITSAASLNVVNGTSFSHTFAAFGNPTPTLSYVPGTLPAGVSLVGDVLSGTPTVPGVYTIDVTATNGVSPDATQTFTLTVTGGAPVITSVETLYVGQGDFMAHTFTSIGNPAPALSYSAINLPPGVTLTGDLLTGYPQLSGTYGITVTATNGVTPDAVQHFALSVGALPEAPPSPFAEDVNFLESTAVRTGVPVPLFDTILVRTMYQYGHSTQWLGNDMYSAGSVGIQGVVNLGVQQAIDLSSGNGDTYWEGGATFCLDGTGPLIWMSAANTPRHAEIIGSYTVPEFPGYTCATLFEPGTLVLVSHLPE